MCCKVIEKYGTKIFISSNKSFEVKMYLSILVKGDQEKSSGSSLKLGAKNPKSMADEWGGDFGNEFVSTEDSGLPMAGEYNWDNTGETDQSDFFSSAMGLPKVRVCFEILSAIHFFSNAGERITTLCTENLFCCEKGDYFQDLYGNCEILL